MIRIISIVLFASLLATPAPSQETQLVEEPAEQAPVEAVGEAGAQDAQTATENDIEMINELLETGEGVLNTAGFSYDDGGRRDPFASLLQVADRLPLITGPRPEGIPGLLIDEVTVAGVYLTPEGPVAQVQAANSEISYLLRPGDQLYDGDVVRITYERYAGAEVVFKQVVNDPTATKPFREVVRRLEP